MDSLVKADIFFFITSIAVVIGTALLAVLLIYGIMIAKDFLAVSRRVKREAELISMDIHDAREHIRKQGAEMGSFWGFLKAIFRTKKGKGNKAA